MQLSITKNSKTPIYRQIKNQISKFIYTGIIPENYILPSERKLSDQLNINRSTVVNAYEELKADGLVESIVGKGTIVLPQQALSSNQQASPALPLPWNQLFSDCIDFKPSNILEKSFHKLNNKSLISFAAGFASPDIVSIPQMQEIIQLLIQKYSKLLFQPCPIVGTPQLQNSIKNLLFSKDIQISTKQIMITSGSQQGIDFLSQLFIQPGDLVIVEEPTFMNTIQICKARKAKILSVPMEDDGLNLEILETYLKKYSPKFIYTIPDFQNPTGIVMSLEKRKRLLKLANQYQVPIIEDNPLGELRFEKEQIPSIKSFDQNNHVIYLSSFSKILFMGFRIGYLIAGSKVIEKLIMLKKYSDLHTNSFGQYLFSELLSSSFYQQHLKKAKQFYKIKRDTMYEIIQNNSLLKCNKPDGGFYLWCKLPDSINYYEFLKKIENENIAVLPGDIFFPNGNTGDNFIRLNYAYEDLAKIKVGTEKLTSIVSKLAKNKHISYEKVENEIEALV
ncbi:MAG: PLP-dependent aminotransferase family protein [Spirochaetes bacterium]|nr:PLP-dependent aminotransferase family protein [Spirochaetota bacterium]